MTRRVIIGGFGSCNRQMDAVAHDLSEYYGEDIEGLSFREANADLGRLDKMTRGAIVITHSAGMMTIRGTRPSEIHAIAPPLPVSAPMLVKRAVTSVRELFTTPATDDERRKIMECSRDLTVELTRHPRANLGKIALIATFNAISSGIEAQKAGVNVGLGFMEEDRLFQMNDEQRLLAEYEKLAVVSLSGGHEKFTHLPADVMAEFATKLPIKKTATLQRSS